jgi:hypothetical protein
MKMRTGPFVPPNLTNPHMAETKPGSVFTPAIAAWSNPGQLGALNLPPWVNYAVMGGLLALAAMKKIPWWAGVLGAGAAWWFFGAASAVLTSISTGTGIVANGTTLQFSVNSPATLTTVNGAPQSLSVGGNNYPVLQTQANPDNTITYYLDNPTPVGA